MKLLSTIPINYRLANKFLVLLSVYAAISACTVHYPAIHLYDGEHKDEQQLAALVNLDGKKFTIDEQSPFPYLPPKPFMKKEIVDAYMVLPGKRDFVFTQSFITGYMLPVQTCTTQYSYCASDDKNCYSYPTTSCSTYKEPIIEKMQSNKISLQLKAGHKYDFSIKNNIKHASWENGPSPYTGQITIFIKTRDLDVNSRLKKPIKTSVSDVKKTFKIIYKPISFNF
jgi:hypothetical protein